MAAFHNFMTFDRNAGHRREFYTISGFGGGAKGATAPFFSLYFENDFERVNLTLLCITNMPTMLYAACPEK